MFENYQNAKKKNINNIIFILSLKFNLSLGVDDINVKSSFNEEILVTHDD